MSTPAPFRARDFLAPRHWPTWLGLGLVRLALLLPYPALLRLGKGLGRLLYRVAGSRAQVARVNVALCFPELDPAERERIVRGCFESAAMALFEAGLSWWGGAQRLRKLHRIEGLEHLEAARESGRGVILLGGHYTTLEISGRFLVFHTGDVQPIYKPAHDPLYESAMTSARRRLFDDLLENTDLRTIVRNLKAGKIVWYAPDQDFGLRRSVFAPFFGVPTATLTTTAGLARLSGAAVLPFWSERLPGSEGYRVRIGAALEGFPSGDEVADATTVNQVIEAQVRRTPEQYLWLHKRFRRRPGGEPDRY